MFNIFATFATDKQTHRLTPETFALHQHLIHAAMRLTVELERMRFHSYHGMMAQERRVGNIFEISASVWFDIPDDTSLEQINDIEETVNYAELAEVVKTVTTTPYDLLETVAIAVRDAIVAQWSFLQGGRIKVTKITPPVAIQMSGASVIVDW